MRVRSAESDGTLKRLWSARLRGTSREAWHVLCDYVRERYPNVNVQETEYGPTMLYGVLTPWRVLVTECDRNERRLVSVEVQEEILQWLSMHRARLFIVDDPLDITVSTTDGSTWSGQVGDNSFAGPCYADPHWAVGSVYAEDSLADLERLVEDLIGQLEEALATEVG